MVFNAFNQNMRLKALKLNCNVLFVNISLIPYQIIPPNSEVHDDGNIKPVGFYFCYRPDESQKSTSI